jgi:hypothetical protein
MTVVEVPAIPKYTRYSKSLGPDDLRPSLANVGDEVRVGRRTGRLLDWSGEDAEYCMISFGFDLEEVSTSQVVFVSRPTMWWENLPEVGAWAKQQTASHQNRLRDIARALKYMREIEEESLQRARIHWSDDEIAEAKACQ